MPQVDMRARLSGYPSNTATRDPDLELAIHLADVADAVTLRWWSPAGVASTPKLDGSPVTEADVEVEEAVLGAVREACPKDGFVGEEVGGHVSLGATGRRWIVDGIDGTNFFAEGLPGWGTLIALEVDGESGALGPSLWSMWRRAPFVGNQPSCTPS